MTLSKALCAIEHDQPLVEGWDDRSAWNGFANPSFEVSPATFEALEPLADIGMTRDEARRASAFRLRPSHPLPVCAAGAAMIMVRDAMEADMAAVQAIYAHHVRHGLATFEEAPPSTEELSSRRAAVLRGGLPYLVAEMAGRIVGYSYATAYRPRPAYRYTIEDSVYVAGGLAGRGIGTALLGTLIERCEAGPWRRMLAIIGHSGNSASIALHRGFGFQRIGTFRRSASSSAAGSTPC